MTMTIVRTYELFDVVFETSRWTGYQTFAEAQAVVDYSDRPARVERRTFEARIAPERLHLYKGAFIAERIEEEEEVS